MQMKLCSRCQKNVAVVFITRIEGNETKNEGLCLKCAHELGLKPVNDIMERMGITEDDIDNMTAEMTGLIGEDGEGLENALAAMGGEIVGDDDGEQGNTATFPFLNKIFGDMGGGPVMPVGGNPDQTQENNRKAKREDKSKKKFLDSYCINLSRKVRDGKVDRIVGRDREIQRVIQILNRRQKNNPCLIGEPGVGKTAVAEGLATRIVDGNVPYKLKDKEVYLLDLTSLVAGTQFRGQFESRMKGLIDEVKKYGNIILVIDEVHNLVGAGDAEGSMNAANILKPALSRGEIQVIGATTFAEYRKHIEKDTALERRFQPVVINEPSIAESIEIIKGIRTYYENYHQVKITDKIAAAAVTLSERYITDRYLPDKAIDLIDEACSDVNLSNTTLERRGNLEIELSRINMEREKLMEDSSETAYELLAQLKSRELQASEELAQLNETGVPTLTMEDLAKVIELWTNIPANRVQEKEFLRLSRIDARLKERIIGQDEAVDAVAMAIRRNRVGISPKHKPVSFIFTGATGVGKTELVKQLAADMFDTPEALIRLDMSEFMEKHSVSKLIGAPPGYVGYDEAGQLTEKVRRRPYCVILFDEIEKAHPDVLNILLQILDDGRVTDAHGRTVSFENTIIIMTSNAGSDRTGGALGFGSTVTQQGKERAMKALSEIMRPEFINRIDEVVAFNALTRDNMLKITEIMLGDLKTSLSERDITLSWTPKVVEYLVDKGFSVKFGARSVQRLIQKELEDVAAGLLISAYDKTVSKLLVDTNGEKLTITLE